MRTLAITQNITVDGSIEMLGDWFEPQGEAGVDNSDCSMSFTARTAPQMRSSPDGRPSRICAGTGPSCPMTPRELPTISTECGSMSFPRP